MVANTTSHRDERFKTVVERPGPAGLRDSDYGLNHFGGRITAGQYRCCVDIDTEEVVQFPGEEIDHSDSACFVRGVVSRYFQRNERAITEAAGVNDAAIFLIDIPEDRWISSAAGYYIHAIEAATDLDCADPIAQYAIDNEKDVAVYRDIKALLERSSCSIRAGKFDKAPLNGGTIETWWSQLALEGNGNLLEVRRIGSERLQARITGPIAPPAEEKADEKMTEEFATDGDETPDQGLAAALKLIADYPAAAARMGEQTRIAFNRVTAAKHAAVFDHEGHDIGVDTINAWMAANAGAKKKPAEREQIEAALSYFKKEWDANSYYVFYEGAGEHKTPIGDVPCNFRYESRSAGGRIVVQTTGSERKILHKSVDTPWIELQKNGPMVPESP